jgi:hypothetical protein
MASVSYSLVRGAQIDVVGASGSQVVTEGTSAPGAGDLEIRIDLTKNFTKKELKQSFDTIWRYLNNRNLSPTIP